METNRKLSKKELIVTAVISLLVLIIGESMILISHHISDPFHLWLIFGTVLTIPSVILLYMCFVVIFIRSFPYMEKNVFPYFDRIFLGKKK